MVSVLQLAKQSFNLISASPGVSLGLTVGLEVNEGVILPETLVGAGVIGVIGSLLTPDMAAISNNRFITMLKIRAMSRNLGLRIVAFKLGSSVATTSPSDCTDTLLSPICM